jgi:hypothetical protein
MWAGTTRYNQFASLISSQKALNSRAKWGAYTIAYENGGQCSFIDSISRSGSSVTFNIVDMTAQTAKAPDSNITSTSQIIVIGLSGSAAVYNGTWTATAVGASSVTATVTGAATSGPTGVSSANGMVASTATVAGHWFTTLKNNESFYLHKQGNSGRRTAWSTSYNAINMNLSRNTTPDSSTGYRWPQTCASIYREIFDNIDLDWAFLDNYIDPRNDVINDVQFGTGARGTEDFLIDGVGQSITSTLGLSAHRQGCADYAQAIRSFAASTGSGKSKSLVCMGNHDSANGVTLTNEMANSLEYAFIENVFAGYGDSNRASILSSAAYGFSHFFNPAGGNGSIQAFVPQLMAPRYVFLDIEPTSSTQYELIRFGMGMCWLHDNAIPIIYPQSGTRVAYDEQKVGVGNAIDPIPTVPYSGTLWKRQYQNMLVLVNAGSSSQSIDLTGTQWKRINGTGDPTTNSGGSAINGSFVVPGWSARMLVINDPGT